MTQRSTLTDHQAAAVADQIVDYLCGQGLLADPVAFGHQVANLVKDIASIPGTGHRAAAAGEMAGES